jgi:hypothetical protein
MDGDSVRSPPEGKGVKRALKGPRKTIAKQGLSPLLGLSIIKYPTPDERSEPGAILFRPSGPGFLP